MVKRLAQIEISGESVSEYDRDKKIVVISKESIKKISLEYGLSEERPIFSILFGLAALFFGTTIGLMPVSKILFRVFNAEQVHSNFGVFVFAIPLLPIGVWLIMRSFRFGHYLRVATNKTSRKLSFGKPLDKETIIRFIDECNRTMGYNIYMDR